MTKAKSSGESFLETLKAVVMVNLMGNSAYLILCQMSSHDVCQCVWILLFWGRQKLCRPHALLPSTLIRDVNRHTPVQTIMSPDSELEPNPPRGFVQ